MACMGTNEETRENLSILNQNLCSMTAWFPRRMKRAPRVPDESQRASEVSSLFGLRSAIWLSTRSALNPWASHSVTTSFWHSHSHTISPSLTTSSRSSRRSGPNEKQSVVTPAHSNLIFQSVSDSNEGGLWQEAHSTKKVPRSANRRTFKECGSNRLLAK